MNEISVALFINSLLGLKVLNYLHLEPNVKIQFIVINDKMKLGKKFLQNLNETLFNLGLEIQIIENYKLNSMNLPDFDFGISAMFGHVIDESIIRKAKVDFINLHPSLLPIGRGANPISWSIIENRPQGATIHQLISELDAGDIYLQKEVNFGVEANAGIIYASLNELLFEMFLEFFHDWINGKIEPRSQSADNSTFHRVIDLEAIKQTNAREQLSAEQFVRRIQALTFANGKTAIFQDSTGINWEITLSLQAQNNSLEVKE
jgi:methionyl-tRNA formyltransferase